MTARGVGSGLLVAALLASCDLDFVEVQVVRDARVSVRSDHTDLLRADVRVIHRGVEGSVDVTVEGVDATVVELSPGDWTHEASVVLDSLDATVNLRLEAGGYGVVVDAPLVARSGPALRSEEGDLHLPTLHEVLPSARQVLWSVDLVDAAGQTLARVQSEAPLPDSLVVDRSLVPAEAVRAHLRHVVTAEMEEGAYPVTVVVESQMSWTVP